LFSESEIDPDLVKIGKAWPELPEHIKTAIKILALTHKAGEES